MSLRSPLPGWLLGALLLALAPGTLAVAPGAAAAQSSATAGLVPLDPADLDHWTTVKATQVTPNGERIAIQVGPNDGDGEVRVMQADGGDTRTWSIGEPGGGSFLSSGASAMALSDDGRWFAFTRYPTAAEKEEAASSKKRLTNGVTIVDLTTGEEREFEGIARYAFVGEEPEWLVLSRVAVDDAPKGLGTDLLLLQLGTSRVTTLGSVGSWALSPSGQWLAWASQSPDRVGNGISIRDMRSGVIETLESEEALYQSLAWADEGSDGEFAPALSVLRGMPDSAATDTTYHVVGYTGFGGTVEGVVVDAGSLAGFPEGMAIAPARAPRWSDDRSSVFFGIAEDEAAEADEADDPDRPDVRPVAGVPGAMQTPPPSLDDEDDLPSLVLWHGRDPVLQSRQQVREGADRRFTYLAAYHLDDERFVQLAHEELESVSLNPGQAWAVGTDRRAYELRDAIDGGQRRDVYAVDVSSGVATPVLEAQEWGSWTSPDGEQMLYYRDGHYHVYHFATAEHVNISEGAPVRFVDVEDDHNREDPPIGPIGWTSDSRDVLLSDGWDVWRVSAAGGDATNLTGTGRAEQVRYRRPLRVDAQAPGWDLSEAFYLEAYGERTKKHGLVRLTSDGREMEQLVWDDAYFTFRRASDAETFVFTRETFLDFPDVWAATGSFDGARRLTELNPQQADYAWSPGARLVDYTSDRGAELQAAMFLPAGYQEGESYPTVVYIYETLSQNLHRYSVPNETRAFNPSVYTSRGYAVLMPDIVYEINDPGMSAVWSVLPAVDAAVETGVVDPDNIGLHGHSWGGYQTAFLVTQTDKFKSVVAGAALTDMVSMYHSVYWNSGGANQAIFESSQGRFYGSPTDNYDAYIRNSPVFHIEHVKSPVLLLHNEKDGAVDFNQGITYFNALREAEKEVVLLQYVGENHGLREPTNQRDYTIRMREYFDHHLKGLPAPDWWTDGVPRLEMNAHLKSRKARPKVIS